MKTRSRDDRPKKTQQTFSSSEFTPEFFKVFLPHFSANQLHIPRAFVYQFKETIQKKLALKDINGRLWDAEVIENEQGFFITKGWENFVMNHKLFSGDFLVFRYDGNACFTVKIFGINGCKKEVSTLLSKVKIENKTDEVIEAKKNFQETETNCMEPSQERPENDKTNGLGKVTEPRLLRSSSRSTKRRSQEPEPEPELSKTKMDILAGSENNVTQSRMTRKRGPPQIVEPEKNVTQTRMATRGRPKLTELETEMDLTGIEKVTESRLFDSNTTRKAKRRRSEVAEPKEISRTEIDLTGTEEVTESVLRVKEEITPSRFMRNNNSRMGTRRRPRKDTGLAESEVPYFIAFIDSYNMDTVLIPETIAKTFNVKLNTKVFLCYQKKRWPVMVCKEEESRVTFGKGWMDFWKENNLSVGDRCMFKFGTTKSSDEIEVRVL